MDKQGGWAHMRVLGVAAAVKVYSTGNIMHYHHPALFELPSQKYLICFLDEYSPYPQGRWHALVAGSTHSSAAHCVAASIHDISGSGHEAIFPSRTIERGVSVAYPWREVCALGS